MKVLMFGWEFPPKIYGGLAVATYGITKGLSVQGDVEIRRPGCRHLRHHERPERAGRRGDHVLYAQTLRR